MALLTSAKTALAATAVAALTGTSATPAASGDAKGEQVTRISLARLSVNGAGEGVRGRILVRTPVASFTRTSNDTAPTARFEARVSCECRAQVVVSKRAVATREGAVAQALRPTSAVDAVIASVRRRDRAWRLVEYRRVDPDTYETTERRRLYGLAVVRIAKRRWMHVRAFADFGTSCSEDDRRRGAAAKALDRLLATARVEASIVPRRR